MKDDALERVLRGLGAVETPNGLEGRVLRRLAEAGSERVRGSGLALRLARGLALAGGLAWCVGVLGHRERGHTPGAEAPPLSAGAERPKAEALGYLQATAKTRTAPLNERSRVGALEYLPATAAPGDEVVEGGGHTPGAKAPLLDGATERPKAEASGYLQAKAGAKTTEPGVLESFPAPPAPLTEQERLLVRIARHPQRGEAQFLIAEVREAELAKGNAEFERFFPPPKPEEGTEVSQPLQAKENQNEVEPKNR